MEPQHDVGQLITARAMASGPCPGDSQYYYRLQRKPRLETPPLSEQSPKPMLFTYEYVLVLRTYLMPTLDVRQGNRQVTSWQD